MKKYLLIGIFGMGGAVCRYGVGQLFHINFPWGTILVNIVGCFLLPVIYIYVKKMSNIQKELITAMGTGFIGAFTTFSAFSTDFVMLSRSGRTDIAVIYLLLSLAGGFLAAVAGFYISNNVIDKYAKKDE